MDIRDMRYFYAVAEAGNITKAAQILHIAQPTISRQMHALEDELGTQLFIRGNRSITLTPAGLLFRRRCEQVLTFIDHTIKEVSAMQDDVSGVLSLGTITTTGAYIVPKWVKRFRQDYPKVTYQLWRAQATELFDLFNKNVIEIAFLTKPFDERTYESLPIDTVNLAIAMHPAHELGKRIDTISLSELADVPLIIPHRYKRLIEDSFSQAGIDQPNVLCDSKSIDDDLLWVKEGIGVAVTPAWSSEMLSGADVVYKTIIDPELTVEYAMIWRRNTHLSRAARCFIDTQLKHLKK
jgi:DNA-binding transcriptional LysR family regulator